MPDFRHSEAACRLLDHQIAVRQISQALRRDPRDAAPFLPRAINRRAGPRVP
jgi:hypothetical protein